MPKISDAQRAAARQRLIDATVAVAERDGVDGLTTRAITAEAGVSPGMFYGHFESKESLLAAVVDSKVEDLITLVEAELSLGAPIESVMREMIRLLVEAQEIQALATFRNVTGSDEALSTQRAINARIVEAFRPLVAASIEAGIVRPDVDADAVIEFIDLALDGLNRRRAADGFVSSDPRVSAVILGAIEAFLLVPQGDPTS